MGFKSNFASSHRLKTEVTNAKELNCIRPNCSDTLVKMSTTANTGTWGLDHLYIVELSLPRYLIVKVARITTSNAETSIVPAFC